MMTFDGVGVYCVAAGLAFVSNYIRRSEFGGHNTKFCRTANPV